MSSHRRSGARDRNRGRRHWAGKPSPSDAFGNDLAWRSNRSKERSPIFTCPGRKRAGAPLMNSIPQPADATGYLENLMRAGHDAVKQFDDALASAAGVRNEELASSGNLFLPFELIVDLQREYLKQVWFLWNAIFLETYP